MTASTIISNEWLGETSKFTIDQAGKVIRTHSQKRLVKFSGQGYNWDVARGLGYNPGDKHQSDDKAYLIEVDLDRQMTRAHQGQTPVNNICILTLQYSTNAYPPYNNSDDPTLSRVQMAWGTSSQTLYAIRDRDGKLIVNAANQPFDGGIPVNIEMPTFTCVRNEPFFDGSSAAYYANCINSDSFAGADPGTLRLKISARKEWSGAYEYWAVTYEMPMYKLGWQPKPVNAGLKQIVSSKLVDCLDANKNPVTSPVPLDTAGKQIPTASLPGAANFITVKFYDEVSFGSLGLPVS